MINEFYYEIGRRIYNLRREKKMNREQLGSKVNYSKNTIRLIENGNSRTHFDTICNIANVLETDVSALVPEYKSFFPTEQQEQRLTFGRNVAKFRKEQGLSQTALGDKIGYHVVMVSNIENGKCNINLETIYLFAGALGVKVGELLPD